MAEKIRVLQSVNSLGIGGSVICVMNFFRHIDRERFQVDFVICDDTKMNFYDEIIEAGRKGFICRRPGPYTHLKPPTILRGVLRGVRSCVAHLNMWSFTV